MTASAAPTGATRRRAGAVLLAFVATLALGLVLLVAFDPDVQTITAEELAARRADARAFLIADFVFVALYAVVSPVVIWRFGGTFAGGRPRWVAAAALMLCCAGVVDAVENGLLLAGTGAVSHDAVDAAHALAIPKVALFGLGALLALAVNVRAAALRARRAPAPGTAPSCRES